MLFFLVLTCSQGRSQKVDSLITRAWQLRSEAPEMAIDIARRGLHADEADLAHQSVCATIIGVCFKNLALADSALLYYRLGLDLRQQLKDTLLIGRSYNNIGTLFRKTGRYDSALVYYEASYTHLQTANDTAELAKVANGLGALHKDMGNFSKSLEYLYTGLELANDSDDPQRMGESELHIGNFFLSVGDLDKAERHFKASLDHFRQSESELSEAKALHNLGNVLFKKEQWQAARVFFLECEALYTEYKNATGLSDVHNNLGAASERLGELTEARGWFNKSLEEHRNNRNLKGEAEVLNNLGHLFLQTDEPAIAIQLLERSRALIDSTGHYVILERVLENLASAHVHMGQYDQAFDYQDQLLALQQQQFSEIASAKERELSYQQAQSKLALQASELAKQRAVMREQRLWNTALITGSVLVTILLVLALFSNRQMHKRWRAEKSMQRMQREEAARARRSMILGQESERERIATDLHDGLGVKLAGAKMGFSAVGDDLPKDNDELVDTHQRSLKLLDEAFHDVHRISHAMHPRSLERFGLAGALKDLAGVLSPSSGINISFMAPESIGRFASFIEINLYRIAEELLGNVLKHADATEAHMELGVADHQLWLQVSDNGRGLPTGKVDYGLGLENIRTRVDDLHGKLSIDSSPQRGTTVRVEGITPQPQTPTAT